MKKVSSFSLSHATETLMQIILVKEYEDNYPWRSSSYGDWSGLRFEVKINPKLQLDNEESTPGVIVI